MNKTERVAKALYDHQTSLSNISSDPWDRYVGFKGFWFDLADAAIAAMEPEKSKKGRPRIEDAHKTLAAQEPWTKAGMSRATWFRRKAERAGK